MSVTNSGIWTVFLSGIFSGAEDTGKSIAAKISETGGSMRGGNLYLYSGIWSKVERLKDSLGMVYENISYYELEEVWKGPMVRLSLMIAAFLISWAIMFFIPRGKTRLSVIGQNTMPVYMLHRILRDILMFAGIYDYLGDWGWIAFFILLGLSTGIVYVLNNSHVVNQVNRILALHTPQLIRNLKRQRAR